MIAQRSIGCRSQVAKYAPIPYLEAYSSISQSQELARLRSMWPHHILGPITLSHCPVIAQRGLVIELAEKFSKMPISCPTTVCKMPTHNQMPKHAPEIRIQYKIATSPDCSTSVHTLPNLPQTYQPPARLPQRPTTMQRLCLFFFRRNHQFFGRRSTPAAPIVQSAGHYIFLRIPNGR